MYCRFYPRKTDSVVCVTASTCQLPGLMCSARLNEGNGYSLNFSNVYMCKWKKVSSSHSRITKNSFAVKIFFFQCGQFLFSSQVKEWINQACKYNIYNYRCIKINTYLYLCPWILADYLLQIFSWFFRLGYTELCYNTIRVEKWSLNSCLIKCLQIYNIGYIMIRVLLIWQSVSG